MGVFVARGRVDTSPEALAHTDPTCPAPRWTGALTWAAGTVAGVPKSAVRGDLKRFKEFIENRDVETGKWRGEIRHGAADDPASQLYRKGFDEPPKV